MSSWFSCLQVPMQRPKKIMLRMSWKCWNVLGNGPIDALTSIPQKLISNHVMELVINVCFYINEFHSVFYGSEVKVLSSNMKAASRMKTLIALCSSMWNMIDQRYFFWLWSICGRIPLLSLILGACINRCWKKKSMYFSYNGTATASSEDLQAFTERCL